MQTQTIKIELELSSESLMHLLTALKLQHADWKHSASNYKDHFGRHLNEGVKHLEDIIIQLEED